MGRSNGDRAVKQRFSLINEEDSDVSCEKICKNNSKKLRQANINTSKCV